MAESHQGLEKMGREKMGYLGASQGERLSLSLQEGNLLGIEDSLQADSWVPGQLTAVWALAIMELYNSLGWRGPSKLI